MERFRLTRGSGLCIIMDSTSGGRLGGQDTDRSGGRSFPTRAGGERFSLQRESFSEPGACWWADREGKHVAAGGDPCKSGVPSWR